jgi:hypothetical protein
MNDNIKNIIELQRPSNELTLKFENLFEKEANNGHESVDFQMQKDKLVAWLVKNHLPIKLDSNGVINIMDSVFIRSPYGVEQCESTNEIILERVRQLVIKCNKNVN